MHKKRKQGKFASAYKQKKKKKTKLNNMAYRNLHNVIHSSTHVLCPHAYGLNLLFDFISLIFSWSSLNFLNSSLISCFFLSLTWNR